MVNKKLGLVAAILAVAGLLTGCSTQISALAPVGGDDIFGVRTATSDVLTSAHIELMVAPVCLKSTTDISCEGTTLDGEPVTSLSPLDGTLSVSVAGKEIFTGTVQEVLDQAVGESP